MRTHRAITLPVLLACLLAAPAAAYAGFPDLIAGLEPNPPDRVPVAVHMAQLGAGPLACSGRFVAHDLDHTTIVPGNTVDQFEANGAGVALGDLDRDGDLDAVLANHAGPNTILWNQGSMRFRAEAMEHGDSRAVNLVDVDGDGWLDMVFTRRTGGLIYWHSLGQGPDGVAFARQVLPGIARPAQAMAWGDLDRDGDLDLVTGSYDAGLLDDLGNEFLLQGGGGVTYYQNRDGKFTATALAPSAQAMAILLFDVDRDGSRDIVVGNDFLVPDYTWLHTPQGWEPASFDTTSHSTMSLDAGDVDNDGVPELFSSDMVPYDEGASAVTAWDPIMADMSESAEPDDPQVMSNVLQVYTGVTGYQNAARPRGAAATGWTWSAKFGDLDQDGWLDLYAVNGMIEKTLFSHLLNHELVEANQARRNTGDGFFRPAPQWGLGSTLSGRGMSMGDLDGDGDLDIVVNNLRGPAQLLENRLCEGSSVQVDLRWPASGNTHAIGAIVALHTSAGTFWRDVRSGSGYLSGDAARLHFGIPSGAGIRGLEITWPDGPVSSVRGARPGHLLTVVRQDLP